MHFVRFLSRFCRYPVIPVNGERQCEVTFLVSGYNMRHALRLSFYQSKAGIKENRGTGELTALARDQTQ